MSSVSFHKDRMARWLSQITMWMTNFLLCVGFLAIGVKTNEAGCNMTMTTLTTLTGKMIYSVRLHPNGKIYVGTEAELMEYNPETDSATILSTGTTGMTLSRVSGLAFDTDGNILLTNQARFCLQTFSLTTQELVTTSGACGFSGNINGALLTARFGQLNDVTVKVVTTTVYSIFYVLMDGQIIKKIDQSNDAVSQLYSGLQQASQLDFIYSANSPNMFMVTEANAVYQYPVSVGTKSLVAGALFTAGSTDGTLTNARFQALRGIHAYSVDVMVVADSIELRMIDVPTDSVSSICGPSHGDIDGDKDTCRLTSPYDVHYYDGKLVVGDWSKIKMFACEAAPVTAVTSGMTTHADQMTVYEDTTEASPAQATTPFNETIGKSDPVPVIEIKENDQFSTTESLSTAEVLDLTKFLPQEPYRSYAVVRNTANHMKLEFTTAKCQDTYLPFMNVTQGSAKRSLIDCCLSCLSMDGCSCVDYVSHSQKCYLYTGGKMETTTVAAFEEITPELFIG